MHRLLLCLALVPLLACGVFAQVSPAPSLMNFQGRLAKPDGTPVANGTYSLRFSLWDAATAGTEKWNQTINPVNVKNGTFAVLLSGFAAGTFNGNLWLEVKVGTDPALTPRQQMVSVAYAMKANSVSDGSITNASIALGTITADKFAPGVFNPLAWLLGGNSGVTSGFLGTTDTNPLVFKVNNRQAMRYSYAENTATAGYEYRSLNVLGGSEINSVSVGVVGATIAGGGADYFTATDYPNRVLADFGTVGGGYGNTANSYATVAGGVQNTASSYSTVGGGILNNASGPYATIAGGIQNLVSGPYAAVGGGIANNVSGQSTVIAGGRGNIASQDYASVGGGYGNTVSNAYATIGGGLSNIAHGNYATVGGGANNTASNAALSATIGGGANNTAGGFYATVGGGDNNTAAYGYDTVGGGTQNIASGSYATVAGGGYNTASGYVATVAGGAGNNAAGSYSFAAGYLGKANHDGTFVWSDDSAISDFASTGVNQFLIRASGGVGINTNAPGGARLRVALPVANGVGVFAGDLAPFGYAAFETNFSGGSTHIFCAENGQEVFSVSGGGYARFANDGHFGNSVYIDHDMSCNQVYCIDIHTGSDARYKTHIQSLSNALDTILQLRGVNFDWNRDAWKEKNFPDGRQVGFIAQEMEKVLPELVHTDARGYKSVAYANVVPVLVEAVKTLKKDNDDKQKQVNSLRTTVEEVKAKNAELEARLNALAETVQKLQNARK